MRTAIALLFFASIFAFAAPSHTTNDNSPSVAPGTAPPTADSVTPTKQSDNPPTVSTQDPPPPITLKHRGILPDSPAPKRDDRAEPCPAGNGKPCALLGGRLYFSDTLGLSRHNKTWWDAARSPGMMLSFGLLVASTVADLETTQSCIHASTCKEGDPLLGQSRAQAYSVSMSLNALVFWAAAQEKRHGHGVLPFLILWSGTVMHATLAAHNSALATK